MDGFLREMYILWSDPCPLKGGVFYSIRQRLKAVSVGWYAVGGKYDFFCQVCALHVDKTTISKRTFVLINSSAIRITNH
jgi:hypothetical protein